MEITAWLLWLVCQICPHSRGQPQHMLHRGTLNNSCRGGEPRGVGRGGHGFPGLPPPAGSAEAVWWSGGPGTAHWLSSDGHGCRRISTGEAWRCWQPAVGRGKAPWLGRSHASWPGCRHLPRALCVLLGTELAWLAGCALGISCPWSCQCQSGWGEIHPGIQVDEHQSVLAAHPASANSAGPRDPSRICLQEDRGEGG